MTDIDEILAEVTEEKSSVCSPRLLAEKWLLTTEDLAFLLGLAIVTIKISRKTNVLLGRAPPPYIKAGRLVRYRRDDVLDWVQELPSQ